MLEEPEGEAPRRSVEGLAESEPKGVGENEAGVEALSVGCAGAVPVSVLQVEGVGLALSALFLHRPAVHAHPAAQAAGTLSCVHAAPALAFFAAASAAGPHRAELNALDAPPPPQGATSVVKAAALPLVMPLVVMVKTAPGAHAAGLVPWQDKLCALHCMPATHSGAASGEPGIPARARSQAAQDGAADMPRVAAGPR